MLAYSYQQNVFLIYSSLKNKTNEEYEKVSLCGTALTAVIYFSIAIVTIYMFAFGVETQVLLNIGRARTPDGKAFVEA